MRQQTSENWRRIDTLLAPAARGASLFVNRVQMPLVGRILPLRAEGVNVRSWDNPVDRRANPRNSLESQARASMRQPAASIVAKAKHCAQKVGWPASGRARAKTSGKFDGPPFDIIRQCLSAQMLTSTFERIPTSCRASDAYLHPSNPSSNTHKIKRSQ